MDLFWTAARPGASPSLPGRGRQAPVRGWRSTGSASTAWTPPSADRLRDHPLAGSRPRRHRERLLGQSARLLEDDFGNPVVLLTSAWTLGYLEKQNPKIAFLPMRRAAPGGA